MKTKIKLLLTALVFICCSCDSFLTRDPLDKIENTPEFYNRESNVRSSIFGLYDEYFVGYNKGWNRNDWFEGTNVAEWVDDLAQIEATHFTKQAPSTSSRWGFELVRRINIIIAGVENSELANEVKNHWVGVGRFLRAMEYSKLVRTFGDVPYFDKEVVSTDIKTLYKPRDPRSFVMDKVLEDLEFAAEHVRLSDGEKGLTINRDVVMAYASRILLFEGTWQKYREADPALATTYLEASKKFAENILSSGRYSISPNYKALTTSVDLAGNPEIIMYRSYVAGVVTHSQMSYQSEQTRGNAPSKDLIDSYLSKNGLPIFQSENTEFQGERDYQAEMADRDPRLYDNIDASSLRLNGIDPLYGISGYAGTRFINESLLGTPDGQSSTNTTDAPLMKLNEVMLNYIEAAAELADLGKYTLTQADFDKTINKIRARESVQMPALSLAGTELSVGGVVINDPNRDPSVSPILWEIRRERRIELVFEGIRFDDLRRWNKLAYADMQLNKKLNLGAWLDKEAFVREYNAAHPDTPITLADLDKINLDRDGNVGYIKPIEHKVQMRTYSEKDYLYPIPTQQITLYENKAKELNDSSIKLVQNPGW